MNRFASKYYVPDLHESEPLCRHCSGTGEGSHDGARCSACRGTGIALDHEAEEDAAAERADRLNDAAKCGNS